MRRNSLPQLGCLTLLLLWAAVGVIFQLFGSWSRDGRLGPDDSGGGTPFAVIGIFGLIAFFVTFGFVGIIRWAWSAIRGGRISNTDRSSEKQSGDA